MKYFFLSEGWTYGRVWEFGGIWNTNTWRRTPQIQKLNCGILQQGETLWLYQVEDAVIMLEVMPISGNEDNNIGQVVLKRLITADRAIEMLSQAEKIFNHL